MTVGIYKLEFIDGSFYVGRSVSIHDRYKDHLGTLKRNSSGCPKLQLKYNELKIAPALSILEECSHTDLPSKEVYWIDFLDAVNKGLNVLPGGEDILYGEKHPGSKYSNIQILEVVRLLGNTEKEVLTHSAIETLTGVKDSTIKDILSGRAHSWLKEEYPTDYEKMMKSKEIRRGNSLKNLNPFANKKTETYPELVSPEGEVFIVEHLTNFCNTHNLAASNLCKVLKGERKHHKGWKLKCK